MKNGELRAIRLTKDAVYEIVRKFFAENGERVFNINNNSDDVLFHFEEDEENDGYIVAVSKFDHSINIDELDLKDINTIDSAYTKVDYSTITYK